MNDNDVFRVIMAMIEVTKDTVLHVCPATPHTIDSIGHNKENDLYQVRSLDHLHSYTPMVCLGQCYTATR